MTDNDYIAEYVKERHPYILGVDYGVWKMTKIITEAARQVVNVFSNLSYKEIRDYMEDCEEEAADGGDPEAAGDVEKA